MRQMRQILERYLGSGADIGPPLRHDLTGTRRRLSAPTE